jgi:hypothetical protein
MDSIYSDRSVFRHALACRAGSLLTGWPSPYDLQKDIVDESI